MINFEFEVFFLNVDTRITRARCVVWENTKQESLEELEFATLNRWLGAEIRTQALFLAVALEPN